MSIKVERNITDADQLARGAYGDRSHLDKRRALYEFTAPHFNVGDEVMKYIGGARVLDVGCGGGDFVLKAAPLFPQTIFTGIDISSAMFQKAQEDVAEKGLPVSFSTGDAQQLPFPDQSFDRVVAMHMLYHVPDIDRAVAEMARVVKPDALVLLTTNSLRSKPNLRQLRIVATEGMGKAEYPDAITRFNLENAPDFLKRHFKHVLITSFESVIRVTTPDPILDYFDSMREFWQPRPEDTEWAQVLDDVRRYVESKIAKDGAFEERNIFGIIISSHSQITPVSA